MAELIERGRTTSVPPEPSVPGASSTTPERDWARARVEKKSKFRADVVAYVLINALLVGIWMVNGFGAFWPGWVLSVWGVLLLLDAWNAFGRKPLTEADIDRELRRTL
jgi:hypothetical protein